MNYNVWNFLSYRRSIMRMMASYSRRMVTLCYSYSINAFKRY